MTEQGNFVAVVMTIACGPAVGLATVASACFGLWARQINRRLDAIETPANVPRPGHRVLAEVTYALANFQVIDEIVTAEGYVPTNQERLAHAFAAWALAGAARQFVAAYDADVEDREAL